MSHSSFLSKRIFDLVFSSFGLLIFLPLILTLWLLTSIVHGRNGFFLQRRVGQYGKPFTVVKLLTMMPSTSVSTNVTVAGDPRITTFGRLLRKYKLDELPQLFNIFIGDMSFVGPRPDVPELSDTLQDGDRRVLLLKPGLTGPATIKYRNEERLLAEVADPEAYNRNVIWPDKVLLNLNYLDNWSLLLDVKLVVQTLFRY